MVDLFQDVTITLNLSEMIPEKYKEIINKIQSVNENKEVNTLTYAIIDSNIVYEPLSEEHKKILESLK